MSRTLARLANKLSPKPDVLPHQPDPTLSAGLAIVTKIISPTQIEVTYNGGNNLPASCLTDFTPVLGQTVWLEANGTQFMALGNARAVYPPWGLVGVNEPFGTGWVNLTTFVPARFRQDGDKVTLGGSVKRSSGTGTTIFILPKPMWPTVGIPVLDTQGDGALASVTVSLTGVVALNTGAATTDLLLDGLHFFTT